MIPPRPIDVSERIEILDILRGFALLGMAITHFNDFVYAIYGLMPMLFSRISARHSMRKPGARL